jgi:transcriptional regulator with XRE-family HTH domain
MIETDELHHEEGQAISRRVREELARRRLSRQALADMARISLSTLEKALSGSRNFTLATALRLEEALGTPLRDQPVRPVTAPGLAPAHMGAYARTAVKWIEGEYLTLRPSFETSDAIYAYFTSIGWDEEAGHLVFSETRRIDSAFAQVGHVSMPNLSGHIYLVTNDEGQYRLAMLGRATREKRMFGILSTLQVGSGSQLVPLACPIAFIPLAQVDMPETGLVAPGSPSHPQYRAFLDTAMNGDFARFRR